MIWIGCVPLCHFMCSCSSDCCRQGSDTTANYKTGQAYCSLSDL